MNSATSVSYGRLLAARNSKSRQLTLRRLEQTRHLRPVPSHFYSFAKVHEATCTSGFTSDACTLPWQVHKLHVIRGVSRIFSGWVVIRIFGPFHDEIAKKQQDVKTAKSRYYSVIETSVIDIEF